MTFPDSLTTVEVTATDFLAGLGTEIDSVTIEVTPRFGPGCDRVSVDGVVWTTVPEQVDGASSWRVPHVDQVVVDGAGLQLSMWSYDVAAWVRSGPVSRRYMWPGWQPTSEVVSIDLADIPSGAAGSPSAPQVWAVAAREAAQAAADAQEALEAVPGTVAGAITVQLPQAVEAEVAPLVTATQTARDEAVPAAAAAVAARDEAVTASTAAAGSAAAANTAQAGAVTARTGAEDARDLAVPAAATAVSARDEAVSARDATLAAVVITGVGRPDMPATMTAAVAALVAAAGSGAVFRSLDGPQGAWEWRKRGSTWACEEGDTGWVNVDWLPTGHDVTVQQARRIGSTVILALELAVSIAGTTSRTTIMPLGFRPPRTLSVRLDRVNPTAFAARLAVNSAGSVYLFEGSVSTARVLAEICWVTDNSWPTT